MNHTYWIKYIFLPLILSSRLLPAAAGILCGESGQSFGFRGRDSGSKVALAVVDAPGSSRSATHHSHLHRKMHLMLFSRATWSHHVLIPSLNVSKNVFNPPREGRQGTCVVSCNRMVPAGVCHVSPLLMRSHVHWHILFVFCVFRLSCIVLAHAGDDCKGKQYSETHTVLLKRSSRPRRLVGALWSVLAYAG